MIFETHAHYDDEAFDEDRDNLLELMPERGIGAVVNVMADFDSIDATYELSRKYNFVYGTVGVHPSDVAALNDEKLARMYEMAKRDKVVAIGEIGLDYYWPEPDHEIQRPWFARQMELAREIGKPIVVHSRDAAQDTFEMMKAAHAEDAAETLARA